jgi:MFS superfamily sulfate permease-like transporter
MPLRPAGTFFVFTVVGALAVALFAGDPQMLWGYVGAFTLTVAVGIGLALRADQHNRALERERRTP